MSRAVPLSLVLLLLPLASAAPLPAPLPSGASVHECVPVPVDQPLLGPETCVNAYAVPARPGVGLEVYNRALADTSPSYVTSMATLGGRLYTVTANGVVHSTDGASWAVEKSVPVGPLTSCAPYATLGTLNGKLYAASSAQAGPSLWRLDPGGWVRVATYGAGCHIYSLHEFGGRLYTGTSASTMLSFDGAALTVVANSGFGTGGNFGATADDGTNVYSVAYPSGIWVRSSAGAWSRVPGTDYHAQIGASQGVVYATLGHNLMTMSPTAATTVAAFPGLSLGSVGDVAGKVAFSASGPDDTSLRRWDGVGLTTMMESWGQGAFGALGTTTYLADGAGAVERLDFLVDERPLP